MCKAVKVSFSNTLRSPDVDDFSGIIVGLSIVTIAVSACNQGNSCNETGKRSSIWSLLYVH